MIPKGYRANFDTLLRAQAGDRLALMECQDKKTGALVFVICAVSDDAENPDGFVMVPLAKMFDGNPYDELNPPNPDGGFQG